MGQLLEKKWNSQKGASMVLAMLFLLLCIAVGGMVLTAAYSNVGRIRRNREDQQAYQAVASAVRLAREEIEGKTYQASWQEATRLVYVPGEPDPITGEPGIGYTEEIPLPDSLTGPAQTPDSLVLPETCLDDLFYRYYASETLRTEQDLPPLTLGSHSVKLKLTGGPEGGDPLTPVEGTLELAIEEGTRFAVKLTLWAPEGEEQHWTTTLRVPARAEYTQLSEESPELRTVTHTLTVTWGEGTITKGEGA